MNVFYQQLSVYPFCRGQVVVNYFSAKICAICGKVCIFLKIINQKFQLWEIYLIT